MTTVRTIEDISPSVAVNNYAYACSADGTAIIGAFYTAIDGNNFFRWTALTGSVAIPALGTNPRPWQCSADGSAFCGSDSVGGPTRPVLWTQAGGLALLTGLGSASGGYAYAISADGLVVTGTCLDAALSKWVMFTWTAAGGMVDRGTLGGAAVYAEGHYCTPDGSVIAGRARNPASPSNWHAVRWTAAGGMVDLGTFGGAISEANGISSDGNTVVGYATTAGGEYRGFVWTSGGLVNIGALGGTYSYIAACSSNGAICVGSYINDGVSGHAMRWTAAGGIESIDTLGAYTSNAIGCSADGATIYGQAKQTIGAQYFVFIWTAATGMVLLPDLATTPGRNDPLPKGANASATMICGYANNAANYTRSVVWRSGYEEFWIGERNAVES